MLTLCNKDEDFVELEPHSNAKALFQDILTPVHQQLREHPELQLGFVFVGHAQTTLFPILDALLGLGAKVLLILKTAHRNADVVDRLQGYHQALILSDLTKHELQQNSKSHYRGLLSEKIFRSFPKGTKLVFFDIGGYLAPTVEFISKDSILNKRVLFAIEDTKNGHEKYKRIIFSSTIPCWSVAESKIKHSEDHRVGVAIVSAMDNLLRKHERRDMNQFSRYGLIGYGRIGSSVARELKGRGLSVYVYDTSATTLVFAESQGCIITRKADLLKQSKVIICATGNGSLNEDDLDKVGDVSIVSVTSPDDEFPDIACLQIYKVDRPECITVKNAKGKTIRFLAGGGAANFRYDGVVGDPIYAVQGGELECLAQGLNRHLSDIPSPSGMICSLTEQEEEDVATKWLTIYRKISRPRIVNLPTTCIHPCIHTNELNQIREYLKNRNQFALCQIVGPQTISMNSIVIKMLQDAHEQYDIIWALDPSFKLSPTLLELARKLNITATGLTSTALAESIVQQLKVVRNVCIVFENLTGDNPALVEQVIRELNSVPYGKKHIFALCNNQTTLERYPRLLISPIKPSFAYPIDVIPATLGMSLSQEGSQEGVDIHKRTLADAANQVTTPFEISFLTACYERELHGTIAQYNTKPDHKTLLTELFHHLKNASGMAFKLSILLAFCNIRQLQRSWIELVYNSFSPSRRSRGNFKSLDDVLRLLCAYHLLDKYEIDEGDEQKKAYWIMLEPIAIWIRRHPQYGLQTHGCQLLLRSLLSTTGNFNYDEHSNSNNNRGLLEHAYFHFIKLIKTISESRSGELVMRRCETTGKQYEFNLAARRIISPQLLDVLTAYAINERRQYQFATYLNLLARHIVTTGSSGSAVSIGLDARRAMLIFLLHKTIKLDTPMLAMAADLCNEALNKIEALQQPADRSLLLANVKIVLAYLKKYQLDSTGESSDESSIEMIVQLIDQAKKHLHASEQSSKASRHLSGLIEHASGGVAIMKSDWQAAIHCFTDCLKKREDFLPDKHPDLARTLYKLALSHYRSALVESTIKRKQSCLAKANDFCNRAITMQIACFGRELHPDLEDSNILSKQIETEMTRLQASKQSMTAGSDSAKRPFFAASTAGPGSTPTSGHRQIKRRRSARRL